jgi:glycosyltransferase involved in cell wall biosynthesis
MPVSALNPRPVPARWRVGVDAHTVDGLYQGSRSHLLGLYREVIARAPDIDFVFLLDQPQRLIAEDPVFASANVCCVRLPQRGGVARLGWQLAWAQWRERLDLLHVQYRGPLLPLGPLACTIHDTLFETHPQFFSPGFVRLARWTGRRAVRQAALLFTVSEFSKHEISRLYGVPASRITVTGNGVDLTRFHPGNEGAEQVRALGLEPGQYWLTLGRIEPRKNHLGLLRAYALLPEPRLPLVVVGQRDFQAQPVFDAVQALHLGQQVRFLEHVDGATLPALLRHARALLYPSFAEGFGMPVVEGFASGVPVLTSATTALAEVAGQVALVADPHQAADLAVQWQRYADDPALRARAGAAGPAQAAQFSWERAAQAYLGALRAHLARREATGA